MAVRVPRGGTRGVPFPRLPRWLATRLNRMMLRRFRRKGGGRTSGGLHTLMLETRGAKSGDMRWAMLGYIDEAAGSWLIVAALAGAARNPTWLHNLAHRPEATVEFGDGRRVEVLAESLEGDQLQAVWARIGEEAPEFVAYRSKTDREIPVGRLRKR